MPKNLKVIFTIVAILLFILSLWLLFCKLDGKTESLITTFLLISIGLIVISYVEFSKITAGGLSIELGKEVKDIARRQLTNAVVKKSGTGILFWVDENGIGHPLPQDRQATANFLANNKGIISDEMKDLIVASDVYPSIAEAKVLRHDRHYFIKYNGNIYYQSGMAWIYKIAALQNIHVQETQSKPEDWKLNDDSWITTITKDEFIAANVKNM